MTVTDSVQLKMIEAKAGNLKVALIGRLDIATTPTVWTPCLALLQQHHPATLEIDLSELSFCDSAGIALLAELLEQQATLKKTCLLQHVEPRLQQLLNVILSQPPTPPSNPTPLPPFHRVMIDLGQFTTNVMTNFCDNLIHLGKLCVHLWKWITWQRSLRWKDFWRAVEDVGPHAFVIISLMGFLMGLVSAFQSALALEKFGAQIYIGSLVGISLVREVGPLMTAVLLAGRTASSFAAEIGTMKINQEIDALKTMGLEPTRFLMLPRVLATGLMAPFMNIFLIFFGLVGCGVVMHLLNFRLDIYFQQLKTLINFHDCIGSLIKATVFGLLIAGIGCLHGLRTKLGASAVGYSTTQAVVSAIIMIIVFDGIFAAVYYALGI
jgi:phospholipid/cholesterol/gamma-HCH transport system permease protein